MKNPFYFAVVAALFFSGAASKASDKDNANFLFADPYGHLDQSVTIKVVSVHPEHYEAHVRDVVWFWAQTGKPESNVYGYYSTNYGGCIAVAVDASSAGAFFHTYGEKSKARADGYIAAHNLTGIFRASDRLLEKDANHRLVDYVGNSGLYFLDCTTDGQFKNVEKPSPSPSPLPTTISAASSDESPTPQPKPTPFRGFGKSVLDR